MSCELCRSLHAACCSVSMQGTAVSGAGRGKVKRRSVLTRVAELEISSGPAAAALIELRSTGGEAVNVPTQVFCPFPCLLLTVYLRNFVILIV